MPKTLINIKTGSIDDLGTVGNSVGTIYFATKTAQNSGNSKPYGQIVYDSPSDGRIVMSQHVEYSDLVGVKLDNYNEIYLGGIYGGSYTVDGEPVYAKTTNTITGEEQSYPVYTELISFKNGTVYAGNGLEVGSSTIANVSHSSASYVSDLLSVNDSRTRIGNDVLTINYPETGTSNIVSTVDMSITANTTSSDSSTGALVVTGGLGVGDNAYIDGILGITANNNTTSITTTNNNNVLLTEISNSENAPFIFNQDIVVSNNHNIGSESYPVGRLQLGTANDGIYYKGTQSNQRMIRMLDNTADAYGNGISIGGGGIVIIGSGEFADSFITAKGNNFNSGDEITYIGADNNIYIEAGGQTIANRAGIVIDTSGHLVPTKAEGYNTNLQNLGSTNSRWAKLYIGGADTHGSGTQPIYWNDGVPTATTYSLNATISNGTANQVAYYSDAHTIAAKAPAWAAWTAGTTAGPKANIQIGNANYESAAIPTATQNASGIITTGTQTFAGAKTFNEKIVAKKEINHIITGSGVAGSSNNGTYVPAKWTFNITSSAPVNGDIITIKTPTAGHTNGVYISTNNGTNYFPVALNGTTRLTNEYPINTCLQLIFESTGSVGEIYSASGGSTRTTVSNGAWRVINFYHHDDDTYDRIKWNLAVKAAEAITADTVVVGSSSGYKTAASGVTFDISYPILWADSAIASGNSATDLYSCIPNINLSTTKAGWSGISYRQVFLVGTLTGTTVTIDSSVFTTTIPSSENDKIYIPIGLMGNSTTICNFHPTGQMFAYKKDSFVEVVGGSLSGGGEVAAPIFENITLAVANWNTTDNTYTVYSQNASASSIQIVSLPDHTLASSDEMDALGSAKLVDGGQGAGYFILKALGDIPEIPIDIRVCYQYSSDSNLSSMQSAAASANQAAASAAQAAASAKVQRKTVTFSTLLPDTSVSPYKYKYEVSWTGVTANDWVDGSGITDQDWAIESATNKVILRFTNNITSSKTVTCYWATTEAS